MFSFFVSQNNVKWTFSQYDIIPYYRRYHTPILTENQQIIRNINHEKNYLAIIFLRRRLLDAG